MKIIQLFSGLANGDGEEPTQISWTMLANVDVNEKLICDIAKPVAKVKVLKQKMDMT